LALGKRELRLSLEDITPELIRRLASQTSVQPTERILRIRRVSVTIIAALIVLYLGVQLVQPALCALSLPDLFPPEQ